MTRRSVPPAPGVVIHMSTGKVLGFLVILVVVLLLGVVLVWAWWSDTPLPIPLVGESAHRWGGISGSLMTAIAALFLPMGALYYFSKERLILADDRLQVVQGSAVVAQVPFKNVLKAVLADEEGVLFLGITLIDPEDPESFADAAEFSQQKDNSGWHFAIYDVYERQLTEIHKSLNDRLASRTSSGVG
jgi:hypothetical protein